MRTLRLVGLDDSGTRLLFRDEDEREHAVEVDDRLVQAVRRTHGWPRQSGPTESDEQAGRQVDTQTQDLRPREIQSRVRAGESPEQVAAAAGVDLERVARFARPVLQEREHIADAAQSVVVRTGALDGPLGEVVTDRLANVVPDTETRWDAWRRDDGRWTVSLTFHDDVQEREARWSFDPTTNSVTVDDETARWLTEGTSSQAPQPAPAAPARGRRLLSVPDLEPDSATHETQVHDLAELRAQAQADAEQPASPAAELDLDLDDTRGTVASDDERAHDDGDEDDYDDDGDSIADELAALGLQPVSVSEPAESQTELDLDEAPEPEPEPAPEPEPRTAKKQRKAAKRASVPSWDDIVFGARKQD